ncbi:unnamed protein product [Camellia sinensis]
MGLFGGTNKPPRTLPESSSSSAVVYKSNTKLIDGRRWWYFGGLSVAIGTSVFDGSKLGIEPYSVEVLKIPAGSKGMGASRLPAGKKRNIGLNLIALIP